MHYYMTMPGQLSPLARSTGFRIPPREAGQQSGGGGGEARGGGGVNDGMVPGTEERPGGEEVIGRGEGLGGVPE